MNKLYKIFTVDNIVEEYKIFICGISKNCINSINSNLQFLSDFINFTNLKVFTIFVDSDSNDGTKKVLEEFSKNNDTNIYINLDGLENKFNNRIERIKISRNKCLETLNENKENYKAIYIPIDLDIEIFSLTSLKQFDELIEYVIKKNYSNGIFPFSTPFYYDIFALRAVNWVNYNSQYWVKKMKKILKVGSFLYNFIFIFRHQITSEKFRQKNVKVKSAFGGAGIYKLENTYKFYSLDEKNPQDVSEHVQFNLQFKELEILTQWKVPAPKEHLEYRLLNGVAKLKYVLRTIRFDFMRYKR